MTRSENWNKEQIVQWSLIKEELDAFGDAFGTSGENTDAELEECIEIRMLIADFVRKIEK